MLKLVVPDYISPSYFPAIAAHQLGYLAAEGLEVDLSLRFPVTEAAAALRDGAVDFIAGAAHAPMYAFPGWRGASVLMALSRNMYWFLVVRADLGIGRGELARVAGLRIGAAPGPDDGLRALLSEAGVPAGAVDIQPVPGSTEHGTSFGLAAAAALRDGAIDGFWANGMGAEVALRGGDGTVVYDARRDNGYPLARLVTFAGLTTRTELADSDSETVAAIVRGIRHAQRDLAADPNLAAKVGADVFPEYEASLIGALIERDAPYYQASVTPEMAEGIARLGRLSGHAVPVVPGDIVRRELAPRWA
ncbi:MAG TPA: ABC transporter substrate-binding protein [Trebonia sp.]|jgi:NitT/TauT family transport system substrate-binding protein|nr:ABC transporter substrate-binding protein [Trebonia sp.]